MGRGDGEGGWGEGCGLPARKADAVMPRPCAMRIDVFDDMTAAIDRKKIDMQWWNGEMEEGERVNLGTQLSPRRSLGRC